MSKISLKNGDFLRKITKLQKLENHQRIIGKLIQKDKESFIAARRQLWLADRLVFATSLRAFVSGCVFLSPQAKLKFI